MWPLYGLMAVRWHLFADFYDVIVGKVGGHPIPRPRGWDLVVFVLGKVYFFAVAFVVPMMFHPWWVVLAFYGIVTVVVGVVLSVVFQLAHAVDSAEFVVADEETNRIENAWAIHQAESTVDFARQSKMAAFLLGGLNYQVEHHLFPRICHVHFPALSREVEATCKEFGVRYNDHGSFWQGVASHYRWLREMGRPEVVPRGVPAAG
jgi:linoleoyl-CoA desaturase